MSQKFSSSRILENIVQEEIPSEKLPTNRHDSYAQQLSDHIDYLPDSYNTISEDKTVQMVIQIDQQNSITLLIREEDDPYLLAKKFCYTHNIDPKVINTLGNNIRNIQKSQFYNKDDYSQLFNVPKKGERFAEINKQNCGNLSNLKTLDSGLKRSKATKCSHQKHNTTFHNDTTFQYPNSNSQANLSKTSVFDRLYNDSKSKHTKRQLSKYDSRMSKSVSKEISSASCAAQLRIYDKNTKLRQQSQNRNEKIKEYLETLNQGLYSHTPEINPVSRMIALKLKQINYDPYKKSKEKTKKKTLQYIKNREQKSFQQCTFKPKILKRNKSKQKHSNSDRYILLHQDFYMRQNKMQKLKANQAAKLHEEKNPFINQISRKIVGGKDFVTRMKEYETNSIQKKKMIRIQHQSNEKFKPEINKSKTTKNQLSESSFMRSFDRLYNYSKSKSKASRKKQKNLKFTNKISDKIYEENKRNAFRYIFTLMDNDEDGLISSLKISIFGLSTQILSLLTPLLCQMEDVEVELDEQEFVESMQRLFKTFTIHEKNMILNIYKNPLRKSKSSEQPSFHPSLNERSLQMAKQIRESTASLYEQGRQREFEREQKLAKLRQLKQMLEFEECTFQPNLFYHHI